MRVPTIRLGFPRRTMRRIVPSVAGLVLAGSTLTGCHGGPHAIALITGVADASFFITEDGNAIWYSDRFSGEIRRRNLSTSNDVSVFTVTNVLGGTEQGLFGVTLHPDYPASPYLYAFATRQAGGSARNHVLRITISGGVGVSSQVIFNSSAANQHNGGKIKFGPDGMLYIGVGDNLTPANSQNFGATNQAGKIHRVTATGAVPSDNPIAGNTLWAYGIRNTFGFGFDPTNGQLWATDNGPQCNDEVDRVAKGGNYAWGPNASCSGPLVAPDNTNQDGPAPRRKPRHFYATPIGITGLDFCSSCGLGSAVQGSLLVGAANNGHIRRLALDSARANVLSDNLVYDHTRGVISLETRPGRPVYFSDPSAIYQLRV